VEVVHNRLIHWAVDFEQDYAAAGISGRGRKHKITYEVVRGSYPLGI